MSKESPADIPSQNPARLDRLLVSIATYNERENLPELVKNIHRYVPHADVLIVDDNSPDGTGQLAEELARQDSRITVKHRSGKLGLGSAIVAGMQHAMSHGYSRFVSMDADGSHDPKYLPALTTLPAECDVMIGSRYVTGGGVVNWPWKRLLISRSVNAFTRVFLGIPARDASGGFRCYRTDLLRKIPLQHLWSKGYSFQEEMLFRCIHTGGKVRETPIIFADRRIGASKANVQEMIRSLGVLLHLSAAACFLPEKL
ncbi:MAG TPA: polyprenol monophosphomannose synthase [Gemmatales bacterium]|nr:polyprenol monophosphomannose synthase [Gemmatales bacterium]